MQELLEVFEKYGYSTAKGSNTYVLASVISDYLDKALTRKQAALNEHNFWTTNNINIATRIAFERYGIYNTRSHYRYYQSDDKLVQTKDGHTDVNVEKVSLGTAKFLSMDKPAKLYLEYQDLVAGSYCVGEHEYHEAGISAEGTFVPGDYVIMPDNNGYAVFQPLRKFKSNENVNITLYTKKVQTNHNVSMVKEALIIDCDYLRFVVRELFMKFKIFNNMSIESLQDYIQQVTGITPYCKDKVLYFVPKSETQKQEIEQFAKLHVKESVKLKIPNIVDLNINTDKQLHKIYTQEEVQQDLAFDVRVLTGIKNVDVSRIKDDVVYVKLV